MSYLRRGPMLAFALAASVVAQACAGTQPHTQVVSPQVTPRALAEQYFEAGRQFANAGDLVRAEQYLVSAWHLDGHDPRILRALLHVCIGGSRFRAAESYAETYLTTHPEDWQLRYVLASLDLALSRRDDAKRELQRVISAQPTRADAYYLLATLEPDGGSAVAAAATRALYSRYLALAPDGPHAFEARQSLLARPDSEPTP